MVSKASQAAAKLHSCPSLLMIQRQDEWLAGLVKACSATLILFLCSAKQRNTPSEAFQLVSKRWADIGFQGTCPDTDFRGMGLLGALNLLDREPELQVFSFRSLMVGLPKALAYKELRITVSVKEGMQLLCLLLLPTIVAAVCWLVEDSDTTAFVSNWLVASEMEDTHGVSCLPVYRYPYFPVCQLSHPLSTQTGGFCKNHSFAFEKTRVIGRANDKIVRLLRESWSSTGTLNRALDFRPAYQAIRKRLESVRAGPMGQSSKYKQTTDAREKKRGAGRRPRDERGTTSPPRS
ncbi:unnamed protein product [Schistocephalus solidus]|uniref:ELMO domain-containing protein n=1 Tax=Schistocephalus solidus TaxID=70667 RepID=A0A183S8N7_SCHSO|nr:unnamed protein product [Schistocephalus solidus]